MADDEVWTVPPHLRQAAVEAGQAAARSALELDADSARVGARHLLLRAASIAKEAGDEPLRREVEAHCKDILERAGTPGAKRPHTWMAHAAQKGLERLGVPRKERSSIARTLVRIAERYRDEDEPNAWTEAMWETAHRWAVRGGDAKLAKECKWGWGQEIVRFADLTTRPRLRRQRPRCAPSRNGRREALPGRVGGARRQKRRPSRHDSHRRAPRRASNTVEPREGHTLGVARCGTRKLQGANTCWGRCTPTGSRSRPPREHRLVALSRHAAGTPPAGPTLAAIAPEREPNAPAASARTRRSISRSSGSKCPERLPRPRDYAGGSARPPACDACGRRRPAERGEAE